LYSSTLTTVIVNTTIRISRELKEKFAQLKQNVRESYEIVIWDLLEETLELIEQIKKDIEQARLYISRGEYFTHAEMKKRHGL
jgi:predicted transcriptional regulator